MQNFISNTIISSCIQHQCDIYFVDHIKGIKIYMTYFLRDFELACLVDLVNYVDLKETWYPLYKEWLQNEHSLNINLNIIVYMY